MSEAKAQKDQDQAGLVGRMHRMRIEAVTSLQALSLLKADWDAAYDADPEAHFFLSWPWMRSRLERLGTSWFVLVARIEAEPSYCVGFLPLRLANVGRIQSYSQVLPAGSPVADYAGFICLPEFQSHVIPAFAECLKKLEGKLRWSEVRLTDFSASDERLRLFLQRFPKEEFGVEPEEVANNDGIDNAVCPRIDLPGSWEEYLSSCVSSNMRQKINRFSRQVAASSDLSIRHATSDTIQEDVEALLQYWGDQWGHRKGNYLNNINEQARFVLLRSFESGSLFMPVLLKNGSAVAALAIYIDGTKKSYLFYMGGRDRSLAWPPPGLVLHTYAIRHAISQGFKTYDFMRGDEPYKFSLGGRQHRLQNLIVKMKAKTKPDRSAMIALPSGAPPAPSEVQIAV